MRWSMGCSRRKKRADRRYPHWRLISVRVSPGGARLVGLEGFQLHVRDALLLDAQRLRGSRRKINDATVGERSAVVDHDLDRQTILHVRDLDDRPERKALMRSREMPLREPAAGSGFPANQPVAVERAFACFGEEGMLGGFGLRLWRRRVAGR